MVSDPVADLLTRLRNANLARHERVLLPCSKLKVEIARILQQEGYITAWKVAEFSWLYSTSALGSVDVSTDTIVDSGICCPLAVAT